LTRFLLLSSEVELSWSCLRGLGNSAIIPASKLIFPLSHIIRPIYYRNVDLEKEGLKVGGDSERHYILSGTEFFPSFLMILRQCLIVLRVEERLRKGKALGSEKGKGLGYGLRYEQKEKN
jgi:hypothetical protein